MAAKPISSKPISATPSTQSLTAPPFDACLPINLVGPFQQTMFLGCSIASFSASVGWSSQASELTVQLVQDPCANSAGKLYYDNLLNQNTWTAADPGFVGDAVNWGGNPPDIIGCAAFFKFGTFEYCGLIQSWQRTDSSSSHPTYTVTLQDPRYILETTKLILKDYAGQITLPNVFNVYGFMESLGTSTCPLTYLNDNGQNPTKNKYSTSNAMNDNDGPIIGSPASYFGGADINANGMPYYNVIQGFNALANAVPQTINQWSLYGRVVYKAPLISGNIVPTMMTAATCGLIMPETALAAYYMVDLSDLPTAPTYYRINAGTTIDLLSLISTICTDAGYEFYIELLPAFLGGGIPWKFIKVRTVRRFSQPTLGAIESYIGTGNGVISSNYGREARLENTNCMYIGGPKQSLYQLEGEKAQADTSQYLIVPYFGTDQWTGNTILPTRQAVKTYDNAGNPYTRYEWTINVNTTFINASFQVLPHNLGTLNNTTNMYYANITEIEMMAAIAGFDAWLAFIDILQTDTGKFLLNSPYLQAAGFTALGTAVAQFCKNPNTKNGNAFYADARICMSNIKQMIEARKVQQGWEEIKLLFKWVQGFASNLGVKFQVAVPFTSAHLNTESAQIVTSENPADSGWTEKAYVLQLQNTISNPVMTFLRNKDDNKIGAMIAFNDVWYQDSRGQNAPYNLRDVSQLNETDYVIYNNMIYVKASVESDYQFENYLARTGPRAILTIPAPVYINGDTMADSMRLFSEVVNRYLGANPTINAANAISAMNRMIGKDGDMRAFLQPLPYNYDTNPFGAAVGIKSNVLTYGPWVNIPVQPPGGAKIETEQGLTPWEYNGIANMNIAGNYLANSAITAMRVGDKGSVNGPGYPALPLGAELGASTFLSAGGCSLAATRQIALGYANGSNSASVNAGGIWQGIYGPNITSINCQVSKEGITTEYQMRTYSQKFGRFEKANIDRLKSLAVWQRKFERWIASIRALQLTQQLNAAVNRGFLATRLTKDSYGGALVDPGTKSPHSLLIGGFSSTGVGGTMNYSITNSFTLPLNELRHEVANYATQGLMSMDGLLRPVSVSGAGGLPQQGNYADTNLATQGGPQPNTNYVGRPKTIEAMPMVKNKDDGWEYDLPTWNQILHPWQNPANLTGQIFVNNGPVSNLALGSTATAGHDIAFLGRGANFKQSGLTVNQSTCTSIGGSEMISPWDAGPSGDYYSDYRGLALKGPLLLQSWGYDTEGRPVPNSCGDTSGFTGIFAEYGSGEQFMADFLKQPNYWPVGPVDLRWDRRRGMWTAPPPYSLLVATVTGEICNTGQYNVQVNTNYIIPQNLPAKDCSTTLTSHQLSIPAINIYNTCYHSGDQVMVWYCSYEKQYYFLAPESNIVSGFPTGASNCCSCNTGCTGNFSNQPTFSMTGVRTFNFSSGFRLSTGNCCTLNVDVVTQSLMISGSTGNGITGCTCPTGISSTFSAITGVCANNLYFSTDFNISGSSNCQAMISLGSRSTTFTISGSNNNTGVTGCTCAGGTGSFIANTGICVNNLFFSTDFNISGNAGCQGQIALANRTNAILVSGSFNNSGITGCACTGGSSGAFSANTGLCANNLYFSTDFNLSSGTNCQVKVGLTNRTNTFVVSGSSGNGITGCTCTGSTSGTFSPGLGVCTNSLYFSTDFNIASGSNCQTMISLGSRSNTFTISGSTGTTSGCTCITTGPPTFTPTSGICVNALSFSTDFAISSGGGCLGQIALANRTNTFMVSGSTGNANSNCSCTGSSGILNANTGICSNGLLFSTDFNIASGTNCQTQISLASKPNTFTISGWNTPVAECICSGPPAFTPNTGICVNNLNFSTDFTLASGAGCQGMISLNRFAPAITISGNSTFNSATGCICTQGTGKLLNVNYQNCVNNLQFSSDFVLANNGYCDTSISLNSGLFGITISGATGTPNTKCSCSGSGTFQPNFSQCTSNLLYSNDFIVSSGTNCQTKIALRNTVPGITISGNNIPAVSPPCDCSDIGDSVFAPNMGMCSNNLIFSNDFIVTSGANCQTQIALQLMNPGIMVDGYESYIPDNCFCSPLDSVVFVQNLCTNTLSFGSGFYVGQVDGESCVTSINLVPTPNSITISGTLQGMNCTEGIASGLCVNELIFGDGLTISVDDDCTATIDNIGPYITGFTGPCSASPLDFGGYATQLNFDNNFNLSQDGCEISIDLNPQGISWIGSSDECPGSPPRVSPCPATGIELGCGLGWYTPDTPHTLGIASNFLVNGQSCNAGIQFDNKCFVVTNPGNCTTATVTLNTVPTQSFTYVTSVTQNGCGIYVATKNANFTSCGLYTGSDTFGGGPQPFTNLCTLCGCSGSHS